MNRLEKDIENEILQYLKASGIFCWKNNSTGIFDPTKKCFRRPGRYHMNGVSDILGIYKGKFLAIEVKGPKGVLSPFQRAYIKLINEHGGIAFMARSIEDVNSKLGVHT